MNEPPAHNPESAQREQALFTEALGRPAGERAVFLDGACHGDPALRQRLEALLIAHEQPATELDEEMMREPDLDLSDNESVGQTLGRYKLLEKVGEGGCGVVYVAEQTEPIRRRVALKVIKLGMDTKQVVARFEAERQALAMMDHPNIAKVLDAGTTGERAEVRSQRSAASDQESRDGDQPPLASDRWPLTAAPAGRPYFVMELVRGIKITDYCDQEKISTKERLDLFIKVCHAIQHAHQKGIIHRDIKPSNILVTLHDGVPVPKVIDFGIAKATEGRLTDATVYTQLHQFIGTPAYMSPEQAEMSGLDIDTRSDIYSLGVLLYELLTGKTPFDGGELMSMGLDAMRKTIREKEPARPSTRLATLQADDLTTTAKRRSVDVSKLTSQLKGDLDWIVMKCLEKDRTRRYETANGLVADLCRHLNNEPIVARPPNAAYKFAKAWRRNKVVYSAVATVAVAMMVGLSVSLWQMQVAQQAEATAQKSLREKTEAEAKEAQLRTKAQADELMARQRAYASDMNVAQQALAGNNLGRALDLLNRQRPEPGQSDLRGWEWRYLWQQTRSDALYELCQKDEIESLTVSSDGRWVAIGLVHKDGLYVYNLRERREVAHLAPGESRVRAAFSPIGPWLAFSTEKVPASDEQWCTLRLWNVATQQLEAQVPLGTVGSGLTFSQDGRQLLTSTAREGNWEGNITRWHIPGLIPVGNSYPIMEHPNNAPATAFAATKDLRLAAYGTESGEICVVRLHDHEEQWRAVASKDIIGALAFSPDGKTLASAAGYGESDIRLWDVVSGNEIGKLEGHRGWVSSLVFWPDGNKLASSSVDQTIRIWDVPNLECVDVLRGHRHEVWRLALLPDNRTLISGGKDGTVCVWDTSVDHPRTPRITLSDRILAWRFHPDSRSVVTLNHGGEVTRRSGDGLEDEESLLHVGKSTNGLGDRDLDVQMRFLFSTDCRFLARGSTERTITVWDVSGRIPVREFKPGQGMAIPLAFRAMGSRLIFHLELEDCFSEWDLETNQEIQKWMEVPAFYGFSLSPDERLGVAVGWHGYVAVRNLAMHENVDLPPDFDAPEAWNVAFSEDGKLLAIASTLGFARVWDTVTWKEQATLSGFLNSVGSVSFSPNNRRLATGGSNANDALKLWDTDGWQEVFTLEVEEGQGSLFDSNAFSRDGKIVGAMSNDGFLHFWRAPSWEEIHTAEAVKKRESHNHESQE